MYMLILQALMEIFDYDEAKLFIPFHEEYQGLDWSKIIGVLVRKHNYIYESSQEESKHTENDKTITKYEVSAAPRAPTAPARTMCLDGIVASSFAKEVQAVRINL